MYMGLHLRSVEKPISKDIYILDGLSPKWCREAHQDKALSPYLLKVDRYQGLRLCLCPNNTHSPLKTSHAKG